MDRIYRSISFKVKQADGRADIALINQYSVRELRPEEVYCFSLALCDNDVDRDNERFTDGALKKMAPLFTGKPGIVDHSWRAENQIARLYRTELETTDRKNALGEPLTVLRGSAYMLRTDENQPVIDAIEGGILKEVSVACACRRKSCSVCGEPMEFDMRTWQKICRNGHVKGEVRNGVLCAENLEDPEDAYEWSFVAVPTQRNAGVTKGAEDAAAALELLERAELNGHEKRIAKLLPKFQLAMKSEAERKRRAEILLENEKFTRKDEHDNDAF